MVILSQLRQLDEQSAHAIAVVRRKLRAFDERSAALLQHGQATATWLYRVSWHGASKQLTRRRTGHALGDTFSAAWFELWRMLDRLDSAIFFRDRPFQAKACRVRSRSEKTIANWLTLKTEKEIGIDAGKLEEFLATTLSNPLSMSLPIPFSLLSKIM